MDKYLNPAMLILIPFLNGIGLLLKSVLKKDSTNLSKLSIFIKRVISTSKRIPYYIWLISIIFASVIGFITSVEIGTKLIIDAIVYYGFIQGTICAFISMGVYDTFKKKG